MRQIEGRDHFLGAEDLLIAKVTVKDGEQLQAGRKVFTLPSVEVGSMNRQRISLQAQPGLSSLTRRRACSSSTCAACPTRRPIRRPAWCW